MTTSKSKRNILRIRQRSKCHLKLECFKSHCYLLSMEYLSVFNSIKFIFYYHPQSSQKFVRIESNAWYLINKKWVCLCVWLTFFLFSIPYRIHAITSAHKCHFIRSNWKLITGWNRIDIVGNFSRLPLFSAFNAGFFFHRNLCN